MFAEAVRRKSRERMLQRVRSRWNALQKQGMAPGASSRFVSLVGLLFSCIESRLFRQVAD